MKFLAILKDSLRETLDTKLLYVTMGLSLLFCAVRLQRLLPPRDGRRSKRDSL